MSNSLKIQILDWYSDDVEIVDSDEENSSEETSYFTPKEYQITIFGRTEEGKSITISVKGFKPFFYVKVPDEWNSFYVRNFIQAIKDKMGRICESGFSREPKFIRSKMFRGFQNEKKFSFIRFEFNNRITFNVCKKQFQEYIQGTKETDWKVIPRELYFPSFMKKPMIFDMYESNIDPVLRCIHIQEIAPSGWISLNKYDTVNDSDMTTELHIETLYNQLKPFNTDEIGKIKICAFDIECNSSHGDFPQAIKDYKKVARDLCTTLFPTNFNEYENDSQIDIFKYILFHAFDINKDEIDEEFCDEIGLSLEEIGKVYTKRNSKPSLKKIETVSVKLQEICIPPKVSLGLRDKSAYINSIIEKVTSICNRFLPPVEGDTVVQIASTVMTYGENKIQKHCLTLGKCSRIEDDTIKLIQCITEDELLLKWQEFIREIDPDIITGYNTYGFDTPFLYDRASELGIENRFSKLGRFQDRSEKLKEKRLSSAALGDNIWRELPMVGRIQVDIMRVVQRDFNLTSYGLDYASSYFMNGAIKDIEDIGKSSYKITTNNTKGLQKNSYVNIMINNGITTDLYGTHSKFKVLQCSSSELIIEGELKISEIPFKVHKCTWCNAKDDIEYNDIFKAWSKDVEMTNDLLDFRRKCAKYCIQDAVLCLDLMKKLDIVANNIGMSNVCSVPLSWIFARGQGVKTLSLVSKQCRKEGFLLPVLFQGDEPEYEGAIVLKPKPGIYTNEAIAVVDYASLYPSCIISENMSHDSIVLDKEWMGDAGAKKLKELGHSHVDIEWDEYKTIDNKKKKVKKTTSRFVQFRNGKKGVIPRILQFLLTARRNTRRKIKFKTLTLINGEEKAGIIKEKDSEYHLSDVDKNDHIISKDDVVSVRQTYTPFQQGIMDGLQKAYKITANSIYGQMGAKTSPVKMIPIAACTTATGRNLLMVAKNFVHDNFQDTTIDVGNRSVYVKKSDTVYGDSVLPDTPLLIKFNNQIRTIRIDELATLFDEQQKWSSWHDTKEQIQQKKSDNILIWTEKGFTRIKRVIRHSYPVPRKIIRVLTHTGIVDVTEDHSLLDMEGVKVKPSTVNIGDQLLHSSMKHIDFGCGDDESRVIVDEDTAWLMGLFFGDGNACLSNSSSGIKYTWKISNEKLGIKVKEFYQKYRTLFYNSKKEKIVPACILNASMSVIESFFDGYYTADGDKDAKGYCRFDNKGKEGTMGLYIIASRLGYNVSINTRQDKPDIYRCTCTHSVQRKNPFAIKKKYILHDNYDEYVYDISTENHHFHVGPGELVVSNTDSVFLSFNAYDKKGGTKLTGKELLKATIDLGVVAGKQITKTLKAPHDLEYEKTFYPFVLLSKKRYVGMKYEFDVNKCKQTSMGIVLKRRDNAKIVKYVYGGAIDIIMKEQNLLKAVNFVKKSVFQLINGHFGMDYLVITKSLRSFYKNREMIAHAVLADRIGERDPGNKPKSNDRIPYVYIVKKETKRKKLLQGDKIELPSYIKEHNLPIDYRHYITNQIAKPVCQVFALELEQLPRYRETTKLKKATREWKEAKTEESKDKKYETYRKRREEVANKLLFEESVVKITNTMNNQTNLHAFFKPKKKIVLPFQ